MAVIAMDADAMTFNDMKIGAVKNTRNKVCFKNINSFILYNSSACRGASAFLKHRAKYLFDNIQSVVYFIICDNKWWNNSNCLRTSSDNQEVLLET